MENLIHQSTDTPSKYKDTWACWSHYKLSQSANISAILSPPPLLDATRSHQWLPCPKPPSPFSLPFIPVQHPLSYDTHLTHTHDITYPPTNPTNQHVPNQLALSLHIYTPPHWAQSEPFRVDLLWSVETHHMPKNHPTPYSKENNNFSFCFSNLDQVNQKAYQKQLTFVYLIFLQDLKWYDKQIPLRYILFLKL